MDGPNQLDRLKRESESGYSGFKVPPGYFEGLTDRVMSRIDQETQVRPRQAVFRQIRSAVFSPRYAAAVAAVVIAIAALVLMPDAQNGQELLAGISDDDAYEYVMNNIYSYNTEDLLSVAEDIELAESYIMFEDDDVDAAIEELLNDIDPNELEELF